MTPDMTPDTSPDIPIFTIDGQPAEIGEIGPNDCLDGASEFSLEEMLKGVKKIEVKCEFAPPYTRMVDEPLNSSFQMLPGEEPLEYMQRLIAAIRKAGRDPAKFRLYLLEKGQETPKRVSKYDNRWEYLRLSDYDHTCETCANYYTDKNRQRWCLERGEPLGGVEWCSGWTQTPVLAYCDYCTHYHDDGGPCDIGHNLDKDGLCDYLEWRGDFDV